MAHGFRSLVIRFLAFWNGLDLKQLGARLGLTGKRVSEILAGDEVPDHHFAPLVAAAACRPAQEQVVRRCLEGLAALEEAGDLSDEEQEEVERGVREVDRLARSFLTEAARISRDLPPLDEYPRPEHLEAARWHAEMLWTLLADMTAEQRLAVVRLCRECQTWWLMERVARESVDEASRDLDRAASLARLAVEIAERVQGPEGWCRRVLGYAAAHPPNVLRVAGLLKEARAGLETAKQHWEAGWDPGSVLDPGRLFDLEASLCRDERDFGQALDLLARAFPVSHCPGRVLIIKAFTLEVMGDDTGAIEALLQAEPLIDRLAEPRLWYKWLANLAVAFCNVGGYARAAELVLLAGPLAAELGDSIDAIRLTWVEGRIAAGQGRPLKARLLLEKARRDLAAREMWYSVGLARQEVAVLLLEEGRFAEVKELARELVELFESKGVHREALAALRLFWEAADREEADVELARGVLRFLLRARHDQSLRFSGSLVPGAAVGVESAAVVDRGTPAAGVEPAAVVNDRPAPEIGEKGLKLAEQAGRAGGGRQEGSGEGGGEEGVAHRVISGAAPAAGLHDPRGARLPAILRQKARKIPAAMPVDGRLSFKQRLARLCRALSGLSQADFGEQTCVDPILIARYETGKAEPFPEHLRRLAEGVDLTVEAGGEVLRYATTLSRPPRRPGLGGSVLHQEAGALANRVAERLLRLPPGGPPPRAEDRERAAALWARLQDLPEDQQLAVVRVGRDFQNWTLVEKCCAESVNQASRLLKMAAFLARLAREIADRVPGPESWRNRIVGYAAAHLPNVARVEGDLLAARAGLEEAKRFYLAGSDPGGLLDPGRLLDLEASLCRDERDPEKALALLAEAVPVSHCPGRVLVNKGFTLEVMGDYEGALATLFEAEPLVDREADPRLRYKHRANLAVVCTHLGRYAEAADYVRQARPLADALGDEIDQIRLTWVDGRILAGLGKPAEAKELLGQARREFAARNMWYTVALADLEIASLLLAEGRTAEVKTMAKELVEEFEKRGVHHEALKALRLFDEAVEREEATAELAGRVLRYLFRAEHQPELAFAA